MSPVIHDDANIQFVTGLADGGTGADLSATGPGVLRQATLGSAVTVTATPSLTDVTLGGALKLTGTSAVSTWSLSDENDELQLTSTAGAVVTPRLFISGAASGTSGLCVSNGNITLDANVNLKVMDTNGAGVGTNAEGVLALYNHTAPTTSPADMIQIFSTDASAGNATLGLRTEAAVVTESVTSDRTLQVKINGTVYKLCLKA